MFAWETLHNLCIMGLAAGTTGWWTPGNTCGQPLVCHLGIWGEEKGSVADFFCFLEVPLIDLLTKGRADLI